MRRLLAAGSLLVATCLAAAGCTAERSAPPDPPGQPALRLAAYDSCPDALAQLRARALDAVTATGLPLAGRGSVAIAEDSTAGAPVEDRAAAPARKQSVPDSSTTNTQEAGVDEPDLADTDGRRIVLVTDGVLRVVDVASRQVTGSVRLGPDYGGEPQVVLAGDRVAVLRQGYSMITDTPATDSSKRAYPASSRTELTLVDVAGAPKVVGRLSASADYLDARAVDGVLRLVVRSSPRLNFVYPDERRSSMQALAENQAVIRRSTLDDWLPSVSVTDEAGRTATERLPCERLTHPARYTGAGITTVYTVDMAGRLTDGDPVGVAADGDTVYATAGRLYLANPRPAAADASPDVAGTSTVTELYALDISGRERPRYRAGGAVPGYLLNAYALSEHDGHLRVATTRNDVSALYVLDDSLTEVGRVDGLGRGERIYGVRYLGAVAYVVTFRQTDPLYAIDLSSPRAPKVTGELKITGYSAYLHPAGSGRLIGVGQEASDQGRRQGTAVSLFDVAAPAPTILDRATLPGTSAEAEYDAHAFLYWAATGLLAVPYSGVDSGVLVLRVAGGKLVRVGTIQAATSDAAPRRTLYIGGQLWTVTRTGLAAYDADSLARRAWVPLT